MKLATFRYDGGPSDQHAIANSNRPDNRFQVGLVLNDHVKPIDLSQLTSFFYEKSGSAFVGCPVNQLITHWHDPAVADLVNRLCEKEDGNVDCEADGINLSDVQLLAPVPHPRKVICVGRNYAEHAAEMGAKVEELPVIFNKFPSSIAAPDSVIALPRQSEAVDFEAELVVVIGRQGKQIKLADAMDYVFGFCCGNDVSARDWQKGKPGGQWLLGKTFDSFAPIGPWIVTANQIQHSNLNISLTLNGESMQADNTSNLIFGIDFLISHLSTFMTLYPGDLLFTGTPSGVGAGRKPPVFLKPGDETVVEIAGLGQLRSNFQAEDD